jgi:hypothetical protein
VGVDWRVCKEIDPDPHGTTLSDFCHESARRESWLRAFTC